MHLSFKPVLVLAGSYGFRKLFDYDSKFKWHHSKGISVKNNFVEAFACSQRTLCNRLDWRVVQVASQTMSRCFRSGGKAAVWSNQVTLC
jgi:hypothetical protein